MAKADVVAAAVSAIQQNQAQALIDGLGSVYDQGGLDQKASDGTFTQADIDSAVAAAQAVDAQALSDAQAKASSDLAAVQDQLSALSSKEAGESATLVSLQSSVAAAQASLAAVLAVLNPAPAPVNS